MRVILQVVDGLARRVECCEEQVDEPVFLTFFFE